MRDEERCRSLASSVARAGRSQCSLGSLLASLRRCALLAERLVVGGYSIVASAQQCPASSRATATTMIERGLRRASSACQRPCRRRALRSAWACTAWGLPLRLRSSVTLLRGGRRWCQAASISSRRTWLLPVLVIAPWRRRSPLECSLGVRPRNGPSDWGRNLFQSPSSTVNANAVSVETPRRQTSPLTTSTYGGVAASSAIALSSASRLLFASSIRP